MKLDNKKIQRIAVLRALQLGDLLCAVPALRALRQHFTQSKISLIGLPWAKEFVSRYRMYIDEFIEFPGFPSLPERMPDMNLFPDFIRYCQKSRFDLVIQMHGNGTVLNSLLPLLNAGLTAGFYKNKISAPDTVRFMPWPQHGHEIYRLLKLMDFLGIKRAGNHLEFPTSDRDRQELEMIFDRENIKVKQRYVCIHPGAQVETRRWLPERFAAVADRVFNKGYDIILTGIAKEEKLTASISEMMQNPSYNLAGKTALGPLAVLFSKADLLITNDTGVSHIASARKTPSVIIVTGSDPERWRPLNRILHQAVFAKAECRPCSYKTCPFKQTCALNITVDKVMRYVDRFLENITSRKRIKCAHLIF